LFAVFKRELIACFRGITGFIFIPRSPNYSAVLGDITFIFLIVVPILTMKLLAEESRQKTDQLLLTSPLSLTGIVLGKYLAAQTIFGVTLAVTFLYPLQLALVGTISVSEIAGGYIGLLLLGSAFLSVGLFVSSLTDNQVVAAAATFGLLLVMWIVDFLQQGLPADRFSGLAFALLLAVGAAIFVYFTTRHLLVSVALAAAGCGVIALLYLLKAALFDGLIVRALRWLSLLDRYRGFTMGVVKLSSVVYYLSIGFIFLFLTVRVLEGRRWK
jgi:ABC-2 type transport system permease protein